jgi:hypothetical protein
MQTAIGVQAIVRVPPCLFGSGEQDGLECFLLQRTQSSRRKTKKNLCALCELCGEYQNKAYKMTHPVYLPNVVSEAYKRAKMKLQLSLTVQEYIQ